jgi:hypothetical protein
MKKLIKLLKSLNVRTDKLNDGIYIKRIDMNFEIKEKIIEFGLKYMELDTLIVIY